MKKRLLASLLALVMLLGLLPTAAFAAETTSKTVNITKLNTTNSELAYVTSSDLAEYQRSGGTIQYHALNGNGSITGGAANADQCQNQRNEQVGFVLFFAKPEEGYALTRFEASEGKDWYYIEKLNEADMGNGNYHISYSDRRAIYQTMKNAGYVGVLGYSVTNDSSTSDVQLTTISEKLLTPTKTITKIQRNGQNYTGNELENFKVQVGDVITYQVAIDRKNDITYSNIIIEDSMAPNGSIAVGDNSSVTYNYTVTADDVEAAVQNENQIVNNAYLSYSYKTTYCEDKVAANTSASATCQTEFTVTYSIDGEGPDVALPDAQTYTMDTPNISVEEPLSAEGWSFSGWTTTDVEVTDNTFTMPQKNVAFTGTWTKTYTLTYDVNGGANGPEKESGLLAGTHDLDTTTVPTHDAVESGAVVFIGWTEQRDNTIYSKDDTAPQTAKTVTISEDKTVYAVYGYDLNGNDTADVLENKYTITYEENKPSGAAGDVSDMPENQSGVLAGTTQTIEETPKLDGYVFNGWTAADATGNSISITDDLSFVMPESNVTVTASWKKNTVTVTYDANGGAWSADVTGYTMAEGNKTASIEVEPYTLLDAIDKPVRAGYKFTDWYWYETDETGEVVNTYPAPFIKVDGKFQLRVNTTEDLTLYAGWEADSSNEVSYTVRQHYLNAEGDEVYALNDTTKTAEEGALVKNLIVGLAQEQRYNGQTYLYMQDQTTYNSAPLSANDTLSAGGVVDLYYCVDAWKDGGENEEDSQTGGDNIPDCYQALILYVADGENGRVDPEFQVETMDQDADGKYASEKNVIASSEATAGSGYEFDHWTDPENKTIQDEKFGQDLTVEGGQTYTYTAYFKSIIPQPDEEDVKDAFENGEGDIELACVTKPEEHGTEQYKKLEDGFTIGEMKEKNGKTYVTVTVYISPYLADYNDTYKDSKHEAANGILSQTFDLVWNEDEEAWVLAEEHVSLEFPVKCEGEDPQPQPTTVIVTFKEGSHGSFTDTDKDEFSLTVYTDQELGELVPGVTADEDYRFTGWTDGKGNSYSSAGLADLKITEDTTFTAQYTKITADTYEVTFNEGKHGTLSGRTTYYVEDGETVPGVPSVKADSDYEFDCWKDQDGNEYTRSQILNLKITEDMTFTAQYKWIDDDDDEDDPTTYGVYYHSGYGKDESKFGGRYEEGENVTVQSNKWFDRDGYIFVEWEREDNDRNYDPKDTFKMPAKDVHFYAVWVRDVSDPDDTGVSDLLNTDDHIQYLYGYPDNTFRPTRNMTRAEAAQMFYNLLRDRSIPKTISFNDVDGTEWFAEGVHSMATLGVIKGYPDGSFQPNQPITRAEFTTMAMQFTDLADGGSNPFSDVSLGDWFYTFVVGASKYGWISGYPDGSFKPNTYITRAEVTSIVNNMLGRYADEDYVDNYPSRINSFIDLSDSYWAYYPIMEATNEHDYLKGYQSEDWSNVTWAAKRY